MTQTKPDKRPSNHGTKKEILLLFTTLMIVMLLASLSQMVLSTALPTIVGELHGVEQMMWVITAYMLASTIMMPIYGKISDIFGRKPLLIAAIIIFVSGSLYGGIAYDMTSLITARIIQGIGGGGLMILSQAAIADVVPARERGKYMGIMGAVFAVSSVAGPLLGGWLTEGPGWRWAFWFNIPLGVLAVIATAALLRLPKIAPAARPKIDYLGMALLASATTAIILIGTWGGSLYDWTSPVIIGLAASVIVLGAAFILVETRVTDPIMPPHMFRDRNFIFATSAGLLTAICMFGVLGYLPTYFQMAVGANATIAGLLMIPMMGSVMLTSVITGAIISRTGRYKIYPIIGSFIMAAGVALLATVEVDTPVAIICIYIAIIGVGLGTSMQILTLVVQNSFPHNIVGTATASNNFFRQVGSSLGSAIVGSIFTGRLATLVTQKLPQGAGGISDGANSLTPDAIKNLPPEIQAVIVESYNEALIPIFLYMVPLALVTAALLFFIREIPLATKIERDVMPEALAEGQIVVTEGMDEGGRSASDAGNTQNKSV